MLSLIIKREFSALLGGKGIRISTAVIVALFLIAGVVGRIVFAKYDVDTTIPLPETTGGNQLEANPFGSLLGMFTIMLLMFIVVLGTSMINQGVVEEKQSRVVEIILTTVKPRTLLLGKILGVGLGVLVVFATYAVGIIGGLAIAGLLPTVGQLTTLGLWSYVPTLVLWLVLGYFTSAAISGGMASMASRQEDLAGTSMIMVFTALVPFYVAEYLVPIQPDSVWTTVFTYVPFFSPYVVTMRAALGQIGWAEQIASAAITVVAIVALAWLAGKIYERSVLHTGSPLKFRNVLARS